jgi:hypothetical protein
MTYDTGRARCVLFGGPDPAFSPLDDTWDWDGNTWSAGQPGPPARSFASMAHDAARGRTVLFGGGD